MNADTILNEDVQFLSDLNVLLASRCTQLTERNKEYLNMLEKAAELVQEARNTLASAEERFVKAKSEVATCFPGGYIIQSDFDGKTYWFANYRAAHNYYLADVDGDCHFPQELFNPAGAECE